MTVEEGATTGSVPKFTAAERYDIVLSFIKALLGGQVSMSSPTPEELMKFRDDFGPLANANELVKGVDLTKIDERQLWWIQNENIDKRVAIILGTTQAKDEERKKAVDDMLMMIWKYRGGERIKGEFLAIPNIESRLKTVEEEVSSHHGALEELKILFRNLLSQNSGSSP